MARVLDHHPDVLFLRKQQARFDVIDLRDIDGVFDVVARETRLIPGSERIAGRILEERGHEVGRIVEARTNKPLWTGNDWGNISNATY